MERHAGGCSPGCAHSYGVHIPGSVNVSSDRIQKVEEKIPDKDTPVYVYCLSGARARGAVSAMKKMGYSNAVNIGGIALYNGELEK